MPRNKGTFKFAASYEVREAYPLDPRMLVETKQELITQDTWPTKDTTIYVYNGLLVSVQQEKAVYMLVDKTKILNEDYSGWKRIDGSQGEPTVIPQESTYLIDSFTILDIDEQIGNEGTLEISFNLLKEAIKNNKIILIKKDYMNSVILCNCYEVETDEEPYYIIETLCNNYLYKIKILDDTIYTSDIEIIEIGSNNGGVDTYVLEFSIEDLLGLASGNIVSLADFNINNLRQAVIDNKVVLINYYTTHGAAIPCACYSEDTDAEFRIEIVLEGRLIKVSIDLNEVEDGIATVTPNNITITELQEKLESGINIKKINGQSILGRGEIIIEGTGEGGTGVNNIYILDVTLNDLYTAYTNNDRLLNCDTFSLANAINSNKLICIHYDYSREGLIPCSSYHEEDFYYISIVEGNNLYSCDFVNEDSDNIAINYIGPIDRGSDWNVNNSAEYAYIKNRTHYLVEHKITEEFTLVGFLYNKCKYDEDTDGYYTTADIKIRYNKDDYEGTIIIQKGTLLGYDSFNDEVTITDEYQGEEFAFISYVEDYNIYFKVSQPNYGTNFRLLEYVTLDEAYIPDTIARKSDLENIGGGGSVDSETIKEIKTTLESHEEFIEDLYNAKIDKENDDYYPNMSVGTADNLAGQGEATPSEFTTRQSGGGAILDGTARIEAIKGNSIVLKQLARSQGVTGSKDNSAGTAIAYVSTDLYVNYTNKINGHKVFVKVTDAYSDVSYYYFSDNVQINLLGETIFTANTTITDISRLIVRVPPGVNANWNINCLFIDLTQMFGAGNEPTTVEEFGKRIPIGINHALYNTGQMINLNPSGIKSYSADEKPIERFQDLSLIGKLFPDGMKSAGEFHDEIRYNKDTQKWEKITRIGELSLDDKRLSWSRTGEPSQYFFSNAQDFLYKDHEVISLNSSDFTSFTWSRGEHAFTKNYSGNRIDAIALWKTDNGNCRLNICCDACQEVAVFKEYLKGKKIYYALNKPIVEELDEDFALNTGLNIDFNLDYEVWNGGIEELVADNPSSALKADIVYGFNAYGKIQENSNKIEELEKNKIVVDNDLNADSDNPISNKLFTNSFTYLGTAIKGVGDNVADLETEVSNKEDKPIEIVLSDPADLIPADTGVTYYLNKTNIGLSEEDSYEDYYQKVLAGNVVIVTGSDYQSSVNKHVYEDCVTFNIAPQFAEGDIMNGSITIHNSPQTSPNGAEYYVEVRIQITANNGGGESGGGSNIEVDAELSDTSENPVQNKVIYEALSTKLESEVVASSSPTEEIPLGYDDTELRGMVSELSAEVGKKQGTITDLETIRSGAEKGATAIQEVKTINGQSIVGSGNIEIQGGGGGNSHWVLRETHTFDGVNGTITYSDLPMEFLALLDYNGTIDVAKKVTFQVGQPELMRAAYDFAASRQMHIGFHLTSDGVITNIVSHSSEWNNKDAATPKILYSSIVLPQAFKLIVYANSIIPEGTTIKIYTR